MSIEKISIGLKTPTKRYQGSFPPDTTLWDCLYFLEPTLLLNYVFEDSFTPCNISDEMSAEDIQQQFQSVMFPEDSYWIIPALTVGTQKYDSLNILFNTTLLEVSSAKKIFISLEFFSSLGTVEPINCIEVETVCAATPRTLYGSNVGSAVSVPSSQTPSFLPSPPTKTALTNNDNTTSASIHTTSSKTAKSPSQPSSHSIPISTTTTTITSCVNNQMNDTTDLTNPFDALIPPPVTSPVSPLSTPSTPSTTSIPAVKSTNQPTTTKPTTITKSTPKIITKPKTAAPKAPTPKATLPDLPYLDSVTFKKFLVLFIDSFFIDINAKMVYSHQIFPLLIHYITQHSQTSLQIDSTILSPPLVSNNQTPSSAPISTPSLLSSSSAPPSKIQPIDPPASFSITPTYKQLFVNRILRTPLINASETLLNILKKLVSEQENKQYAFVYQPQGQYPYSEKVLSIDTYNNAFRTKFAAMYDVAIDILLFLGYSYTPQTLQQQAQHTTLDLSSNQKQRLFLPDLVNVRALKLLIKIMEKMINSIQPGSVLQSCSKFHEKGMYFDRLTSLHDRSLPIPDREAIDKQIMLYRREKHNKLGMEMNDHDNSTLSASTTTSTAPKLKSNTPPITAAEREKRMMDALMSKNTIPASKSTPPVPNGPAHIRAVPNINPTPQPSQPPSAQPIKTPATSLTITQPPLTQNRPKNLADLRQRDFKQGTNDGDASNNTPIHNKKKNSNIHGFDNNYTKMDEDDNQLDRKGRNSQRRRNQRNRGGAYSGPQRNNNNGQGRKPKPFHLGKGQGHALGGDGDNDNADSDAEVIDNLPNRTHHGAGSGLLAALDARRTKNNSKQSIPTMNDTNESNGYIDLLDDGYDNGYDNGYNSQNTDYDEDDEDDENDEDDEDDENHDDFSKPLLSSPQQDIDSNHIPVTSASALENSQQNIFDDFDWAGFGLGEYGNDEIVTPIPTPLSSLQTQPQFSSKTQNTQNTPNNQNDHNAISFPPFTDDDFSKEFDAPLVITAYDNSDIDSQTSTLTPTTSPQPSTTLNKRPKYTGSEDENTGAAISPQQPLTTTTQQNQSTQLTQSTPHQSHLNKRPKHTILDSSDDEDTRAEDARLLRSYHRYRMEQTGQVSSSTLVSRGGIMLSREEALKKSVLNTVLKKYTVIRIDLGQLQEVDPKTKKLLPKINPNTNKAYDNIVIQGVFFTYESYKEVFAWIQSYMIPMKRFVRDLHYTNVNGQVFPVFGPVLPGSTNTPQSTSSFSNIIINAFHQSKTLFSELFWDKQNSSQMNSSTNSSQTSIELQQPLLSDANNFSDGHSSDSYLSMNDGTAATSNANKQSLQQDFILTYPQFALLSLANMYMTYSLPKVLSSNPTVKSPLAAPLWKAPPNTRHLTPYLPYDLPMSPFDEIKLNPLSSNSSNSSSTTSSSKNRYGASNSHGIDIEKFRLLDGTAALTSPQPNNSTSKTSTSSTSMTVGQLVNESQLSTSMIGDEETFSNANPYVTLYKQKLVPQGLLRLIPRLQEDEVCKYPSYHLATDNNINIAFNRFRAKTPYVSPFISTKTSNPSNSTMKSTLDDGNNLINDLFSGLPDELFNGMIGGPEHRLKLGQHIIFDLQGSTHGQDICWINGVCFHRALLWLGRTNNTPSFVRAENGVA